MQIDIYADPSGSKRLVDHDTKVVLATFYDSDFLTLFLAGVAMRPGVKVFDVDSGLYLVGQLSDLVL